MYSLIGKCLETIESFAETLHSSILLLRKRNVKLDLSDPKNLFAAAPNLFKLGIHLRHRSLFKGTCVLCANYLTCKISRAGMDCCLKISETHKLLPSHTMVQLKRRCYNEVDCLHSDEKHYHAIVANVKESRSNNCNEFQLFWVEFVSDKHNPLWVSKHVLALHREGFSLSGAEQKYNAAFIKKTYNVQHHEFQTNPVRRPRDAAVELSESDEKEGPMPHMMYRHHHHLKMTMVHLQMIKAAAMVRRS